MCGGKGKPVTLTIYFLFKKWKYTLFTYPILFTVFKYSH